MKKMELMKYRLANKRVNESSESLVATKDIYFLITITILLSSSKLFNAIRNRWIKRWASVSLSFILILIGTEFTISQLVISTVYGLILSSTIYRFKNNPRLSTFCYLISFGLITALRIQFIDKISHYKTTQTNLVLMMILLRSISLAFDLQEFGEEEKEKIDFSHIFTYLFCHIGLIIGPFYRYHTYKDWICQLDLRSNPNELKNMSRQCNQFVRQRIPLLSSLMLFFLVGSLYFPLNPVEIDHQSNFLTLFIQTILTFYIYRARLYIGFIFSEISCILHRLGIYPADSNPKPGHGPTLISPSRNELNNNKKSDTVYSSDTIKCFSSFTDVELSGSVQQSLRNWNSSVQFWLAHYCYRKLKGNSNLLRIYITLFISASWHGNYSGYFFSFAILPIVIESEKGWQLYVKEAHSNSRILFLVFWTFKISLIAYHGMAFFLLKFDLILEFYRATYFWGHIAVLVFAIYALVLDK